MPKLLIKQPLQSLRSLASFITRTSQRGALLCLIFLCMSTASIAFADTKETIQISTGEWPPWVSASLKHNGLSFRLIEAAFEEAGIPIKVHVLSWSKAYDHAKEGKYDATGIWFSSEERRRHFLYSDTVVQAGFSFFHLKDKEFAWKTIDDLKGLNVGATLGYTYPEDFFKAETQGTFTVDWVPTDLINLNKLLEKEIDVFPCDVEVGYFLLQKHHGVQALSKVRHHPKPLRADPLSLLFPKTRPKSQALLEAFNQGLKKVRDKKLDIQFYEESRKGMYLLEE